MFRAELRLGTYVWPPLLVYRHALTRPLHRDSRMQSRESDASLELVPSVLPIHWEKPGAALFWK
jgi:hypothetical protein